MATKGYTESKEYMTCCQYITLKIVSNTYSHLQYNMKKRENAPRILKKHLHAVYFYYSIQMAMCLCAYRQLLDTVFSDFVGKKRKFVIEFTFDE